MNYRLHYERLMSRARGRFRTGYMERHHVLPKCLGGGDDDGNIVLLTAEEHYIAHQLLVKMYPGDHRLVWAAVYMAGGNDRQPARQNKIYGWLRRRFAEQCGKRNRGRVHTPEACEKMSATRTGLKRGPHSIAHKAALSQAKKGRKFSESHRAAMSAARIGKKRGPHRQETIEKIRKSNQIAVVDRSYSQADDYRQTQSDRMHKIWAERRAGRLPQPNHHKEA